jgi:hypothetical protein
VTTQLQLPLDANNETNWLILKKLENLIQNLTVLLSDKLPHFHGQFTTCGDW